MSKLSSTAQKLIEDETGDYAIWIFLEQIMDYDPYPAKLLDWVPNSFLDKYLNEHFEDEPRLTADEAIKQALAAKSLKECKKILLRVRRRPKGRPATPLMYQAVKVLIYKVHLGPHQWHWPKLANRFCPCGNVVHTHLCNDNLSSTVKRLKRLLREYELEFLADQDGEK